MIWLIIQIFEQFLFVLSYRWSKIFNSFTNFTFWVSVIINTLAMAGRLQKLNEISSLWCIDAICNATGSAPEREFEIKLNRGKNNASVDLYSNSSDSICANLSMTTEFCVIYYKTMWSFCIFKVFFLNLQLNIYRACIQFSAVGIMLMLILRLYI